MKEFISKHRSLFNLLKRVAILAVIVFCILKFVMGFFYLRGNYMYPAIRDGDLCMTFKLETIIQNDIVEYRTPDGEKKLGRLIGLPGDKINISEVGMLTINGYQPSEEVFYQTALPESSNIKYPYTVPEDCYFILNDFRSDTKDSRTYGAISKKDVIGKVIFDIRRRGF